MVEARIRSVGCHTSFVGGLDGALADWLGSTGSFRGSDFVVVVSVHALCVSHDIPGIHCIERPQKNR